MNILITENRLISVMFQTLVDKGAVKFECPHIGPFTVRIKKQRKQVFKVQLQHYFIAGHSCKRADQPNHITLIV